MLTRKTSQFSYSLNLTSPVLHKTKLEQQFVKSDLRQIRQMCKKHLKEVSLTIFEIVDLAQPNRKP